MLQGKRHAKRTRYTKALTRYKALRDEMEIWPAHIQESLTFAVRVMRRNYRRYRCKAG